jgi:hypothetical protein
MNANEIKKKEAHYEITIRARGPTQPPVQGVPGALSPILKRPGCEADYSPPSSAEVKNAGAMPPLPDTS